MGQGGLVKCVQHSRPNSNVGQGFDYDFGGASIGEIVLSRTVQTPIWWTGCFNIEPGLPIGSDTLITEYLHQQVFPKLKASIDAVAALLDSQVAYLLLRHCVSGSRITHLMRTIPLHVVTGFLQRFDIEVVHAFETVTAVQLNRHAQQQLALPLNLGGFGLSNTGIHAPCAYVASISSVSNSDMQKPGTSWNIKPPGNNCRLVSAEVST
ncbi:hypothetical protein GJ496_006202 [Pomphorhynchus laevis]|nr:hypothetical protein GJ496_006202 [Pomphorhynchus laevis]